MLLDVDGFGHSDELQRVKAVGLVVPFSSGDGSLKCWFYEALRTWYLSTGCPGTLERNIYISGLSHLVVQTQNVNGIQRQPGPQMQQQPRPQTLSPQHPHPHSHLHSPPSQSYPPVPFPPQPQPQTYRTAPAPAPIQTTPNSLSGYNTLPQMSSAPPTPSGQTNGTISSGGRRPPPPGHSGSTSRVVSPGQTQQYRSPPQPPMAPVPSNGTPYSPPAASTSDVSSRRDSMIIDPPMPPYGNTPPPSSPTALMTGIELTPEIQERVNEFCLKVFQNIPDTNQFFCGLCKWVVFLWLDWGHLVHLFLLGYERRRMAQARHWSFSHLTELFSFNTALHSIARSTNKHAMVPKRFVPFNFLSCNHHSATNAQCPPYIVPPTFLFFQKLAHLGIVIAITISRPVGVQLLVISLLLSSLVSS